jgi:ATP-dependent protease ClpP protease subunit
MSRIINLIGDVNEDMVIKLFDKMDELESESNEAISINLCSDGGVAYDAIAIAGRLHDSKCTIKIRAYGRVMSAAILILAVGDKRTAQGGTWFMVHEDAGKQKGSTTELVKAAKQMRQEEKHWDRLLEYYTATPVDRWTELSRKTTYFTAEVAKGLGLLD